MLRNAVPVEVRFIQDGAGRSVCPCVLTEVGLFSTGDGSVHLEAVYQSADGSLAKKPVKWLNISSGTFVLTKPTYGMKKGTLIAKFSERINGDTWSDYYITQDGVLLLEHDFRQLPNKKTITLQLRRHYNPFKVFFRDLVNRLKHKG